MQRSDDNRQRAYQTLRGGRMVWVYPGETPPPAKLRSRQETDDEVRARIMLDRPWWTREEMARHSGPALDRMLKNLALPPRKIVDEPA